MQNLFDLFHTAKRANALKNTKMLTFMFSNYIHIDNCVFI